MKKIIFLVLIALISVNTFARKIDSKTEAKMDAKNELSAVSICGNVIDEVSGEALVGVEVKVDGSEMKTYTDFDGHFVIDKLKPGKCKLVASYTSYNKKEKSFDVDLNSKQVKIELQASK